MHVINLVLSDKEAIVLHMTYDVGASAIKGESVERFAQMVYNARHFVDQKMTLAERLAMKAKLTELGNAIDPEALRKFNVLKLDQ